MDMFWKWLMHTNAKALFAVTVLACLGVVMWVGFKGMRKEKSRATRSLEAREPLQLDLLSFVDNQLRIDAAWHPTTPFRPSVGRRVMPSRTGPEDGARPPDVGRPDDGGPILGLPSDIPTLPPPPNQRVRVRRKRPKRGRPQTPGVAAPPSGVASPQSVVLTYHGVLQRSDGVTLALVADSVQQTRGFYRKGDELAGMRVTRVGKDAIWVRDAGGTQLRLTSGDPVTCLDGLLVLPEPQEEVLP